VKEEAEQILLMLTAKWHTVLAIGGEVSRAVVICRVLEWIRI
jgi:hypothetical protein